MTLEEIVKCSDSYSEAADRVAREVGYRKDVFDKLKELWLEKVRKEFRENGRR